MQDSVRDNREVRCIQSFAERRDELLMKFLKMGVGGLNQGLFEQPRVTGTEAKLGHLEAQHPHKIRHARNGCEREDFESRFRNNSGDELVLDDEIFDQGRIRRQAGRNLLHRAHGRLFRRQLLAI